MENVVKTIKELCDEIRKGINESFFYLGKMEAYSEMNKRTSEEMLRISEESLKILKNMNNKLNK